jgi:hypothetical protein
MTTAISTANIAPENRSARIAEEIVCRHFIEWEKRFVKPDSIVRQAW